MTATARRGPMPRWYETCPALSHDAKAIDVHEGGQVELQGTLYRCKTCDRVEFVDPQLPAKCQWPDCEAVALCSSGNFGGWLVCREHFGITNGPAMLPRLEQLVEEIRGRLYELRLDAVPSWFLKLSGLVAEWNGARRS